MGRYVKACVLVIFVHSLGSCVEDELKKPTTIVFEFSMNTLPSDDKFLQFDQGNLIFNYIEFDGDRETGKDVFFISKFDDFVEADLDANTSSEPIQFDVPQGVYNRIKLKIGNENSINGPAIVFNGIYNSAKNEDIPIRLEFDLAENLEITAQAGLGSTEIVLKTGVPAVAELSMDPNFLFQLGNSRQLESATISTVDGQQVIIISKDNNSIIYNTIINRLERSAKIIFD